MSNEKAWQSCAKYPGSLITNFVAINSHEFITGHFITSEEDCLLKYDARKNEWNKYLHVKGLPEMSDSMYLHSNNKILFITTFDGNIIKLNTETNEFKHCEVEAVDDGTNVLLAINDDIHLIGGDSTAHLVLRQNQMEPIKVCNYGDTEEFYNHHSIYSKKNQVIYTFGGCDENDNALDTIYSYNLKTNKHKLLDLKIPDGGRELFGCVMTNDEKYIIILGGSKDYSPCDEIYIFDMEEMSVRISNVKCPDCQTYIGILMNDDVQSEIIVPGYIRLTIKQFDGAIEFLCDDIISLMIKWFAEEMIYLMDRSNKAMLWKMHLSVIIM